MKYFWTIARLFLGWIFLWPFLDKTLGLGFTTTTEQAWINGGSPTSGFLLHGTKGPLADLFQSLAGVAVIDWLFMLGLLCIGTALLLGIAMRVAVYSGVTMLLLMYIAGFIPPEHNPFLDEHLMYSLFLLGLLHYQDKQTFTLSKPWKRTALVKAFPILK